MPVLHPDTVVELLHTRTRLLQKEIAQARILLETAHNARLPRLLLIEGEYHGHARGRAVLGAAAGQ